MKRRKTSLNRAKPTYDAVLKDVVALIEAGRRAAVRSSNLIMTATYWAVGCRIVEEEQLGAARAEYGTELMTRLSADLSRRFGRGFGQRNVFHMRAFYLAYRGEILQMASARSPQLEGDDKLQTASAISGVQGAPTFPLPWSHYVRLLSVKNLEARRFYEGEALRGGWNIRQLDRQIGTQFYERTALSRNKAGLLRQGRAIKAEDVMTPEEEIKDPFFFEFLDLLLGLQATKTIGSRIMSRECSPHCASLSDGRGPAVVPATRGSLCLHHQRPRPSP